MYVLNAEGELLYSSDNGKSWMPTLKSVPGDKQHFGLLPVSDSLIFATGQGAASTSLYKSSDGGKAWERVGNSRAPIAITQIGDRVFLVQERLLSYLDLEDPNSSLEYVPDIEPQSDIVSDDLGTFYIASSEAIYVSADTGLTWTRLPTNFGAFELLYTSPGVLIAVSDHGIFRSADRGQSWYQVSTDRFIRGSGVRALTGEFIASGFSQVYRSLDQGESWTLSTKGIRSMKTQAVFASTDGSIIVGSSGFGILEQEDENGPWTLFSDTVWNSESLRNDVLRRAVQFVQSSEGTVFAATDVGIYRRPRMSSVWEKLTPGSLDYSTIVVPSDSFILAKGGVVFGGPLVRSVDGGVSWDTIESDRYIFELFYDPVHTALYGIASKGGSKHLFESHDSGQTWSREVVETQGAFVHVDPLRGDIYRVERNSLAESMYVFRSSDQGDTWVNEREGLRHLTHALDLVVTPDNDRYLVGGDSLVYVLRKGATFWTVVNTGSPKLPIKELAVLPDGRLLADADDAGLYVSSIPVTSDVGLHLPDQNLTVVDLGGGQFWLRGVDVDPNVSINLWNLLGESSELAVDRVDLSGDHIMLNCDHLPDGVYIVSFRDRNGSYLTGLLRLVR